MWSLHLFNPSPPFQVSEVNVEYARAMNKISFDEALRRGGSNCDAPLVVISETFPTDPAKVGPLHGHMGV